MRKPRLLLADDHAIVLEGLTRLLEPEFEVIGKVEDGRALLKMSATLKPDVIVADISMPLLSGIEAVRQLRRKDSRTKVIFLSMHSDVELASEAIRLGASGYVLKHSAAESLSKAIHQVLKGRVYVSPRICVDVLSSVQQTSRQSDRPAVVLTQREREVLQLVSEGRTIRGIANILDIAGRTVVFHKCNLMDKLGIRTTAELTRYAFQSGLVAAEEPVFISPDRGSSASHSGDHQLLLSRERHSPDTYADGWDRVEESE